MTEEEITWKMPTVGVSSSIKMFPDGFDDGKPHLAFVARVHDRSIDIKSPLGTSRGGVRFIGDPCMARSEELRREYGAWDFTDEAKMVMESKLQFAKLQSLENRIKTLEELLDKKTK
jgi:hypothetical protein